MISALLENMVAVKVAEAKHSFSHRRGEAVLFDQSQHGNRRDLVMTLYCLMVDQTRPGEHDDHR